MGDTHLITLTDHARFLGSELRVCNSEDRVSAVRVLESSYTMNIASIVARKGHYLQNPTLLIPLDMLLDSRLPRKREDQEQGHDQPHQHP